MNEQLDLLAGSSVAPRPDVSEGTSSTPGLWLTRGQRSHLHELARLLGVERVAVVGFDTAGQPTISRRDARGVATYSLHRDGRGVDPAPPVAPLPDADVERFAPDDWAYLMSFPSTIKEA